VMENELGRDRVLEGAIPGRVGNDLGGVRLRNALGSGFDPEGSGYDMEAGDRLSMEYPLTIPKPNKYEGAVVSSDSHEAWVWHPELNDYLKHGSSLDPKTGMVLKGTGHKTYNLTLAEEKRLGNTIVKKGDRYYSVPDVPTVNPLMRSEAFGEKVYQGWPQSAAKAVVGLITGWGKKFPDVKGEETAREKWMKVAEQAIFATGKFKTTYPTFEIYKARMKELGIPLDVLQRQRAKGPSYNSIPATEAEYMARAGEKVDLWRLTDDAMAIAKEYDIPLRSVEQKITKGSSTTGGLAYLKEGKVKVTFDYGTEPAYMELAHELAHFVEKGHSKKFEAVHKEIYEKLVARNKGADWTKDASFEPRIVDRVGKP